MEFNSHSLKKMLLCRSHCQHCGKIIRFLGYRCRICRMKFHKKCSNLACVGCFKFSDGEEKTGIFRRHIFHRKKKVNLLKKYHHIDHATNGAYKPVCAGNIYTEIRFTTTNERSRYNGSDHYSINHIDMHPDCAADIRRMDGERNYCNRWHCTSSSTQSITHDNAGLPSILSSGYSSVNHSCSTSAGTASQRSRSLSPDHFEAVQEETMATSRLGDHLFASYDVTMTQDDDCYQGNASTKDGPVFYMESDEDSSGEWDECENYKRSRQRPETLQKVLRELEICYSDLEIEQKLGVGPNGPVFRGRWHGDVIVHTRQTTEQLEVEEFRKEVALLSTIRHENVMLFMGACLEPPNLAVVTSLRKCLSVHNYIHCQESRLTMPSRLNVMLQVAQGMSYLHAKYITVSCLQTMNIYLDSKVKLCINGYTNLNHQVKRHGYGSLPQGHLTYLAPEVMTKVNIDLSTGKIVETTSRKPPMDVYAFGTVMYEILTGKWPFEGLCPETVIWMVGKGLPQSLAKVKGPDTVKDLIKSCWSHGPNQRPTFVKIIQILKQNNMTTSCVSRRHSFSEPEKINCIGKSVADLCHIKRI